MDGQNGSGQPAQRTGSAALARLLPAVGGADVIDRLAALSGSDFTSVMLEIARRRAAIQTPASVLRRYRSDRFARPGAVGWRAIRRTEDALTGALPDDVDLVTLAPLVPIGTHSALATVSQDKVLTTIRASEVAADPTNALALEAADRRVRSGRAVVRLAAVQRVVRAQQIPGGGYAAHFGLLGLVTAGPDEGSSRFERVALAGQLRYAVAGIAAAGLPDVQLALTPLSPAGERITDAVAAELAGLPAEIVIDHGRQAGRGYYLDVCFKINARFAAGGDMAEVGDGGFTDWTRQLAASAKERLLICGLGIERIAGAAS